MYESFVYMYACMCTQTRAKFPWGLERTSDSLDLELGMVVNHHVCAGEAQEFLTAELSWWSQIN